MTKSILSEKTLKVLKYYGCLVVEKLSINCLPIYVKYLPVPTNSENPSRNPKLIGAFRKSPIKIMFWKPPMYQIMKVFNCFAVITGRKIVVFQVFSFKQAQIQYLLKLLYSKASTKIQTFGAHTGGSNLINFDTPFPKIFTA
jgi:hypothetical protein